LYFILFLITHLLILFLFLFSVFYLTAKAIDQAQKVNARERAAMRRDIQREQVLAVGAVSKSVGNLKSEIDLLSEKESKRNGKFR
jgi:translation elongation factor EF-Tu-like GTPase